MSDTVAGFQLLIAGWKACVNVATALTLTLQSEIGKWK
jgi:hypothetical protein